MADRNGYIGRAPGDSSVIVARQTFQPTGVQTDFTFSSGYDPGYLDVYLNGSRLIVASDYTATDGSVVGLTSYAENGDVLEFVAYKAFNLGSVNNAAGNFDVGVDLTVNNDATITGDLTVSGTTTLGAGTSVSYATTAFALENSPNISVNNITGVAATHSGVVKVTDTTASTTTATGALIVSGGVGIAKSLFVGGNISAGGTVSYEDVTNVDSVGIITAGKGFRATTGGIIVTAGVITATDGVHYGSAGAGGSITAAGDAVFAGIVTASDGRLVAGVGINSGGTNIGYGVTTLNFIGTGNTFLDQGSGVVDVSISGSAGGGGAVLDITACLFI